ncbi:hypothetical protein [Stygiolobus azoricus]|uniref:VapB-type antitoxin n=1 Tax=Stygiolobus azoricus TaxID=41675 RepID=A0A650CPJ6_9CREN|nr:hypothetical protein [Stygiolobus azoricus]QGR19761.1 hypothetical protein D1868_06995 [Stygiolobus azoricus]
MRSESGKELFMGFLKSVVMEIRKADSKGRIYLGNKYAGRNFYVVKIFDGILLLNDEIKAKEIEEKKEEFLKGNIEKLLELLGEPTVEEMKEVVKRSRERRFSSIQT